MLLKDLMPLGVDQVRWVISIILKCFVLLALGQDRVIIAEFVFLLKEIMVKYDIFAAAQSPYI